MKYNLYGTDYEVTPVVTSYAMGGTAILLVCEDGEPFGSLTVNLGYRLPDGWAFIDTNNLRDAEKFIADNNLGTPTGIEVESGFCSYPQYRLNMERLNALSKEAV